MESSYLDYFREVFRIVVRSDSTTTPSNEVSLSSFVRVSNYDSFDANFFIEQGSAVVFDRLQLSKQELEENVVQAPYVSKFDSEQEGSATQFNPIIYLYESYVRCSYLKFEEQHKSYQEQLQTLIIEQAAIYLMQRDLYQVHNDQSPVFLELLDSKFQQYDYNLLSSFLVHVVDELYSRLNKSDRELDQVLNVAYYVDLNRRVEQLTLTSSELRQIIVYTRLLCGSVQLGCSFIRLNSPWHFPRAHPHHLLRATNVHVEILKSLLGNLLSISCLPCFKDPTYSFFTGNNSQISQELSSYEVNLGSMVFSLVKELHQLFHLLLKSSDNRRELALNYFGLVLHHFHHRCKLWANEMSANIEISDGFMLNFCHILLLLCKPFADPNSERLLKVSPKYAVLPALPFDQLNTQPMEKIHLRNLDQESYLVPKPDSSEKPASDDSATSSGTCTSSTPSVSTNNFNFMTEIFFLAHKALQLGFKSTYDRFLNTISEISQFERYNEMTGISPEEREMFRKGFERHITKYLSTRTMLFQENFVELCALFGLASCSWLTNLAMYHSKSDAQGFPEVTKFLDPVFIQADFEKPEQVSPFLKLVPEFLCENISDFFIFVRRFVQKNLLLNQISFDPLMTFILTFMGSPLKMKNPHLRAKLAEILEELMPKNGRNENHYLSTSSCTELFQRHRFIEHLVPTLIHVFVSIEVTGQSVAFEQKFQYRRPMYIVMRYLWTDPIIKQIHRAAMRQLSVEAVERIEDPLPPLFLRFINLLTNDAIFLLDEGLQQMSKLKRLQQEKQAGQWNNLSREEKVERERDFIMTEKLARFHNVMGKETIHTLSFLTEEIKDIFCSSVMLDRIVSMLNYFLMHLVGQKSKQFRVVDGHLYEFKPASIVYDICKIYANLGVEQNNHLWRDFCKAIKNDGRSYSDTLLPSAVDVLYRTGNNHNQICDHITKINNQVNEIIEEEKKEEINVNDIPEEFLDPIMNTIMREPVRLPSNYILDKSTIARHLLSDQTDPFTRLSLTMEMIKPELELKTRIDNFIREYLEKKCNASPEEMSTD